MSSVRVSRTSFRRLPCMVFRSELAVVARDSSLGLGARITSLGETVARLEQTRTNGFRVASLKAMPPQSDTL